MASLFLTLVWAHLLLDYALQGDFMSKAKNEMAPIAGVPWVTVMWSHAFLQAGPVAFLTGSFTIGFCEFVAHTTIDRFKCNGWIGFNTDQALHIACKIAWVALATWGLP
jgi:hypothetical protein